MKLKALTLLTAAAFAFPANGQSTIVVPTGQPTVQMGLDAASPGDTVLLLPGVYQENVQLREGVKLVGSSWEDTILDGSGAGNVVTALQIHGFELENVTIRNSGQGPISPGNAGVFVDGQMLNFQVDARVRSCRIEGNGQAILIWNVTAGLFEVDRCIITENLFTAFSPYLGQSLLTNNTIAFNGGSGVYEDSGGGSLLLENNLVAFNGEFGIRRLFSTPVSLEYNDFFANGLGNYWQGSAATGSAFTPVPGTGEIQEDPVFISSSTSNYFLSPSSPCVDAGHPASPLDPDGTPADIGALPPMSEVGTSYCTANPNSSGGPAFISAQGSPYVSDNDLVLVAGPVPVAEPGIFYYGPQPAQVPFGNGFRCVSATSGSVGRFPFVHSSAVEGFSFTIDFTALGPGGQGPMLFPGSTRYFQCWFRDPAGGGPGHNLSDGLAITFMP